MTSTLKKHVAALWAVVAVVAILLATTPQAQAQEDTPSTKEVCEEWARDESAVRQLIDEKLVDQSVLQEKGGRGETKALEEIKNGPHKKRFKEITDYYLKTDTWQGKLAKFWDSGFCAVATPIIKSADWIGEQKSKFWNDPVGKFTNSVMEGSSESIATAMKLWIDFSTTSVDIDSTTRGVKNIVMGVAGFALIAAFLMGGYRISSGRRGGLSDGLNELNENILRWLLFSIAVPAMFPGAMLASDMLADAIMTEFGSPDQLINLGGLEDTNAGPILTLALAGITLVGSLVQILALVTRVLLAPIVVGLTPLFAALSFSDTGRQGLNHLVAFLIAAIIFKPISALLYSVVLWQVSQTGDIGITGGIINALMIGIAGFSAPALVRSLVPAVAQAGGGGAAPMLAGATGAIAGASGMAGAALAGAGKAIGGQSSSTGQGASLSATGTGAGTGAGSGAGSGAGTGARQAPGGSGSGGAGQAPGGSGSQPSGARPNAPRFAKTRRVSSVAVAGAGMAAKGAGKTAQAVGNTGQRSQGLFDDSIGVPGHYAGQAHR